MLGNLNKQGTSSGNKESRKQQLFHKAHLFQTRGNREHSNFTIGRKLEIFFQKLGKTNKWTHNFRGNSKLQYLFYCAARTTDIRKSGNKVIRGNTYDRPGDQSWTTSWMLCFSWYFLLKALESSFTYCKWILVEMTQRVPRNITRTKTWRS